MSAIERRGGLPGQVPLHARQLGQRVKPIIRLGMGVKVDLGRGDGSTRPQKTDHFTVRGDERAVAKFTEVYGEKPKAVKIMVPSELSLALDISYRAFVGGSSEEGGRPLALGMTNFAPLGYVGGADVLRVWRQDGKYEEVETQGLDELGKPLDEIAESLGIEVHTTFTFTLPDVLGWGSFAAITSKGKKSADNLTYKLSEVYSAFGSQAPWAFSADDPPLLVLKPDSALMRMEDKKGEGKWAKSSIYVLDIVIPESFNDMRERLAERQREIAAAGGPGALVYGQQQRAIEASAVPDAAEVAGRDTGDESADTEAGAGDDGETSQPPSAEPEPVPADESGSAFKAPAGIDDAHAQAAWAAGTVKIPSGVHAKAGRSLADVAELGSEGEQWLLWALKNWSPDAFRDAVELYVQVYVPDVWERFEAWKAEQS